MVTLCLHMMLTFELGAYNQGHKTQSAFILDQTLVKVPSVNHSPNLNSRPHLKEVHYENFTRIKTNLILSWYLSSNYLVVVQYQYEFYFPFFYCEYDIIRLFYFQCMHLSHIVNILRGLGFHVTLSLRLLCLGQAKKAKSSGGFLRHHKHLKAPRYIQIHLQYNMQGKNKRNLNTNIIHIELA